MPAVPPNTDEPLPPAADSNPFSMSPPVVEPPRARRPIAPPGMAAHGTFSQSGAGVVSDEGAPVSDGDIIERSELPQAPANTDDKS
jgi:hypothetical protein